MKYLVNGGAGFIGSNLTERLVNDGHKVIIVDNLSTGNLKNLEILKNRIDFIKIPVSETLNNKKIEKIDGIFHFGIPSSTPLYRINPYFTGEAINEFITILELAKREKCKIVYASSSSIYNGNQIPFKEDMSIFVKDLYSEARYSMERLAKLYHDWYNVKSIGLRFFSVYGKHEEYKKNFANLITQFLWDIKKNKKPIIYGDGNQTRDFTYIKDIIEGCILSMNSSINYDIFNLGSGNHFTLNEMVEILSKIINKKIECEYITNPLKGYVQDTLSDTSKAKKLLGYESKYTLEKGIKEILTYYESNQKEKIYTNKSYKFKK